MSQFPHDEFAKDLLETLLTPFGKKESESLMKLTTSPVFLEYVERITQDGRIEEGRSLVLRLLNRKLGNLSPKVQAQVNSLMIDRLESLGEDLLDFTQMSDLLAWLDAH